MNQSFKQFGGWQKFFQILCMLNVVFSIASIIMLIQTLFSSESSLTTFFTIIESGLTVYLLLKILKIIELNVPESKVKIINYLFTMFLVAIGYFIISTFFEMITSSWVWTDENTYILAASLQMMIWCALWQTYFTKSKRVKEYYSEKQDVNTIG